VSRYQKGKTDLDFTEARDSEWQWHQLGYMQVSTSLQTDNHANTPPLRFFTGRMPFLLPNQQRQSTEGKCIRTEVDIIKHLRMSRFKRCFTGESGCPGCLFLHLFGKEPLRTTGTGIFIIWMPLL